MPCGARASARACRPARPAWVSCSPFPPLRPMPPTTSSSITMGKPPTNAANRPSKLSSIPKASLPGRAGPLGGVVNRCVERLCPAAVNALFQAICGPVMRAPSIRSISIGKPPSSTTQTVSFTPISFDLATAALTIRRASSTSRRTIFFMFSVPGIGPAGGQARVHRKRRSARPVYGFNLQEELQTAAARLTKGGRAGTLESAERCVHEIAGGGAVDLDGARLNVVRKTVRIHGTRCGNGGRQTVFGVVGDLDRLVVAAHFHNGQHRAENFFARDTHGRGDVGKDRRCQVKAVIVVAAGKAFTADQVGCFALADLDI